MSAIEVRGLTKIFDDLVAVDSVDMTVEPGEIVGFVGANGAGKTTYLRMLAGITQASAGEITLAGHRMTADSADARGALAFVADTPSLFESLTVYEHMLFVSELYGVDDAEPRIDQLLTEFELSDKRHATASALSRGMRQKVMICCAFVHDPEVLLLDEPLTGLDPLGRRRMCEAIEARARAGAAVIVSSHQLDFVERLSTRFAIIHKGRIRAQGSREEVRAGLGSLEEVFLAATGEDARAPDGEAADR